MGGTWERVRRTSRWLVLLGVGVLGAACTENALDVVHPDIQVDPMEVDLGTVTVGLHAEATLNIRNVGDGTLDVASVRLKYPERLAFTLEDFAGELVPDQMTEVLVTFDPAELGPDENVAVITSDDPDEPEVEVPIRVGDVVPEPVPGIEVEPESLDWGALPTGASEAKTITIRSVGTAALDLSAVRLSGGTSLDFSLTDNPAPDTLAPGDEVLAAVEYAPTDDVDDAGSVLIESDDPDRPLIEVPLSGSRQNSPDIEVEPTTLDFGVLGMGASSTLYAEIRNVGTADLTLGTLTLSGSSAFVIDTDPSGSVMPPGTALQVGVTVTVLAPAAQTGLVTIPSDDPDEDPTFINLQCIYDAVPEIEVEPLVVDFGSLEEGTIDSRTVTVSNIGDGDLQVSTLTLTGSDDFTFSSLALPGVLPPGASAPITVTYFVSDEVADAGTLSIASNDADEPVVDVALLGAAELHPDIEVTPPALDFGTVTVGSSSALTATIANVGDAPLDVTDLSLVGGAFALTLDPAPATLLPGDSTLMEVTYTPPTGSSHSGTVTIASTDPDEPTVVVPLNGAGLIVVVEEPPVADAGPDREEIPLDTITLDGSGSYDPDGDVPLTYAWTLVSKPGGSTTALTAANTVGPSLYLDLAGTYVVGLVVTDTTGLSSTQDQAIIDVVPWQDFHVQLVWDADAVDLDLHLVKTGTSVYDSPNDCCWCNLNPNWGGGGTEDNPSLDIDDLNGYGPENINIVAPTAGDYGVAVVYYGEWWGLGSHPDCNPAGVCTATTATIRVYLNGIQVYSDSRLLSADNQVWYVGDVDWPTGVVTPVDTVTTTTRTGCF